MRQVEEEGRVGGGEGEVNRRKGKVVEIEYGRESSKGRSYFIRTPHLPPLSPQRWCGCCKGCHSADANLPSGVRFSNIKRRLCMTQQKMGGTVICVAASL